MALPPTAAEVAQQQYARRQLLVATAAGVAARQWAAVDDADIALSWTRRLPAVTVATSGAQWGAAQSADPYVAAVLQSGPAEYALVAAALAGVAADGRPLLSLLYQPVITALTAIRSGQTTPAALLLGAHQLDTLVRTEVADAGRTADQIAATTHGADGYVRLTVGRSCSRCIILAGRWYPYSTGFQRHPNCVPAGTVVSGPRRLATTRRWYEGELAVIATASGQQLAVTGNHPVLTDRGWLPANLVQEGDHVVRCTSAEGAVALAVPHEHEVPARVEDVWRAGGVVALRKVPTSTEDFHGDGGNSKVDVVLADSLLRDGHKAEVGEHFSEVLLARGVEDASDLLRLGALDEALVRNGRSAYGSVGTGCLSLAGFGGHLGCADHAGLGPVARRDASLLEAKADDVAAHAVAQSEAVLALAGLVRRREFIDGQGLLPARWDAPSGPLTVESRGAYAERGQDLLVRLSSQVTLDRVVENRRVGWKGHVYNLTSAEGWFVASGLIVSNCDCVMIPAREGDEPPQTPEGLYATLTPEQRSAAGWSQAEQRAIADGADIAAVTNIHRGGLYVAGGRQFTYEAAGRRPRITPRQIYLEAGEDRAEAIRLLRLHGYIR